MALYLGQDFSTFQIDPVGGRVGRGSMDLGFTPIDGVRAAQETILRKLLSPPGSYDDEAWGLDLPSRQNAAMSSGDLAALQNLVAGAIEEEEYVESATAECVLAAGTLVVDVQVTLLDGETFTLAVALSAGSVQTILRQGT